MALDQPPAERRLISVVFLDLEDFTGLVEALDPEDARELQRRYFAAARKVIEDHGGTVEKFIGDAVMGAWGVPQAHEDDAERAVRAALAAVSEVARLEPPNGGGQLRARAGVASGEAAAGPGFDGAGLLTGEPVNIAARLQAAAPAGGVLVDEASRRLAGHAVRFEPAGLASLKGMRRQLATWTAAGLIGDRRRRRPTGARRPLVGRDGERSILLAAFSRAIASDRPVMVTVTGGPGIGKSRLVQELDSGLYGSTAPAAVLVGRATAHAAGRPFAPVGDVVRQWAGLREASSPDAAARALGRALKRLDGLHEGKLRRSSLVSLVEPTGAGDHSREELFASWRHLFEQLSRQQPLVLVFEDLQWADPGTLDFLEHLAAWADGGGLLIVAEARSELYEMRPDWPAGVADPVRIELGPLPDEAMAELLEHARDGLSRHEARQIIERADGVPLYAVELIRLRAEAGGDVGGGMPDTLRAVVGARIDALPADERGVLLHAAVIGRRFDLPTLQDLQAGARREPGALDELVGRLVEREMLAVPDPGSDAPSGPFRFVQDLVRDVAYRTISRADRRLLHLAAADHLKRHRPEDVEEIAEHLYRALRLGAEQAADGASLAERATAALAAAADRAMALHVAPRALTHLERALEAAPDGSRRLELMDAAASAARAAGRFDRAEELLRTLTAEHAGRSDDRTAARFRAQLASLMLAAERHASALQELEDALGQLDELESDPAAIELAGQLARARVLVGDDAAALAWAERTMQSARRRRMEAAHVDALTTRGTARLRMGRAAAGRADLRRAITAGQRLGLARAELRARNNLAWLVVLDDPHTTLDSARGGLELALRMGLGDMALQLALVYCMVAIDTGDWDEGLAVMEELREHPQPVAHRIQFAAIESTYRALRGTQHASRPLDELGPLPAETDPQIVGGVELARAWLKLTAGHPTAAQQAAARAAGAALGAEQHIAGVLELRCRLWQGQGQRVLEGLPRLQAVAGRGAMARTAEDTLRAGAMALAGDARASALYDDCVERWQQQRLPLHLALCLIERKRLLGEGTMLARAVLGDLRAEGLERLLEAGPARTAQ
jgi:class 3 adenylate cyclase